MKNMNEKKKKNEERVYQTTVFSTSSLNEGFLFFPTLHWRLHAKTINLISTKRKRGRKFFHIFILKRANRLASIKRIIYELFFIVCSIFNRTYYLCGHLWWHRQWLKLLQVKFMYGKCIIIKAEFYLNSENNIQDH